MYKLLIVEDERWEREGLVEFADWAAMGIGAIVTACDGIEGLEKAIELEPDIVITDIQMPGRNGIEMARLIKERQPDASIVVLTGFDDFQFARDALRFRAVDYLLKPIEEEELLATMARVIRHCEETRRVRLEEARKARTYETGRRAALQRTFAALLAGREAGPEAEAAVGAALAAGRTGAADGPYAVWS
ncbi:response regulator, partial [Paenibacillus sp. MWE-103]